MEKRQRDKKATVSRSRPLIGSADAPEGNAKRKTPEQIALEIQSYFAVGGTPQQFKRDTEFIAAAIREAVNDERKAGLEIYERGFENRWVVQDVIDAIRAPNS